MTDRKDSDPNSNILGSTDQPQEFDRETFAEWIETQAVDNDMSEQRLASELISSYSLVKELSKVVDEPETDDVSRPEEVKSNQNNHSEDISAHIADLDDRLSECEDRVKKTDEIAELKQTTDYYRHQIDTIRDRVRNVEEETEQIRSSQEATEKKLAKELDTIEAVFDRLFENIESLETQFDELVKEYRNDIQSIQREIDEQDRLTKLKREALRLGIKQGKCEACGEVIHILQLESSDCPNCEGVFTDISGSTWIPFKSPVVETKPPQVDIVNTTSESGSTPSRLLD